LLRRVKQHAFHWTAPERLYRPPSSEFARLSVA
jgi:hypothetical protein